jgi:hypothetical protein
MSLYITPWRIDWVHTKRLTGRGVRGTHGDIRQRLVFWRHLSKIDDENLHRAFCRFQFQSKLFLNCSEDRRSGIG